jgi:hypothetical protein
MRAFSSKNWQQLILYQSFLMVLMSCNSKSQVMEQNKSLSLIGTWIQSDYKISAETEKSAITATNKLDDVGSCLIFDKSKIPFSFGLLFNSHVGGGRMEMTKYSELDSCYHAGNIEKPYFKLKVKLSGRDTFLIMKDNPKLNGIRIFTKISKGVIASPFSYVFRAFVFYGKYDVFDATNKILFENVTFERSGALVGFGGFKRYEIETDYSTQPEDLDEIHFDDKLSLEYKFDGSEILFFEREKIDPETTKRGSLIYRLVKKN